MVGRVLSLIMVALILSSSGGKMTTLRDIADKAAERETPTAMTTAGWVMPPLGEGQDIIWRVRAPEWIAQEAARLGKPLGTRGFTQGNVIYTEPLNTLEQMELLRHEAHHAIDNIQGRPNWHGRKALEQSTSCLTDRCRRRMEGVHPDLVRVVERASLDQTAPFFVICGLRTQQEQAVLVQNGKSKTMNSRHLTGHAVDLAAIEAGTLTWNKAAYENLAGSMKRAALAEGVAIRCGVDFVGFFDGPHFELPRKEYPDAGV